MNQVLWGVLSAISLGSADFAARFTSQSIGYKGSLFGMLLVSCIILTAYMLQFETLPYPNASSIWLIVGHGVFFTAAMLALYAALAIGPIKLVAPLVASHPALVVVWAILNGASYSTFQGIGFAMSIVGVIAISYSTLGEGSIGEEPQATNHHKAIAISAVASLLYAAMLIFGQKSAAVNGVYSTLWFGRLIALGVLITFCSFNLRALSLPFRWWPVLIVQGVLDSAGILFLLFGSFGENREITVVISAAFGAVTVILAWLFLKERLTTIQWLAAILIFAGACVLSTQ